MQNAKPLADRRKCVIYHQMPIFQDISWLFIGKEKLFSLSSHKKRENIACTYKLCIKEYSFLLGIFILFEAQKRRQGKKEANGLIPRTRAPGNSPFLLLQSVPVATPSRHPFITAGRGRRILYKYIPFRCKLKTRFSCPLQPGQLYSSLFPTPLLATLHQHTFCCSQRKYANQIQRKDPVGLAQTLAHLMRLVFYSNIKAQQSCPY